MRKIVVPTKADRAPLPDRSREGAGEGGRPKLGLKYGGTPTSQPPEAGGEC